MIEHIRLKNGELMAIDFDIETNLPKLPEGYFWRITPPVDGAGDSVYGRDKHSLLCKLGRNCRKCERSLV